MNLSIVSPESLLFKGEVDSVTLPGTSGYFQILNNHTSLVSTLASGKIKIQGKINLDEINKKKFEFKEGFTYLNIISGVVEVLNNKVTLLTY